MTPEEIVVAAYGYSKKSQPSRIANEEQELRLLVGRVLQAVFAVAARVNWTYFGNVSTGISYSSGWAWPSDVELVGRIERASDSAEVIPTGIGETDVQPGDPTVYQLGRKYEPGANITTAEDLVLYYSRSPTLPPDFDSTDIDTAFPDQHLPLIILETALYLALKDGRRDEMQALAGMRDAAALAFVQHLEHATVGIPRSHFPQRFQNQELVPLLRVRTTGEE